MSAPQNSRLIFTVVGGPRAYISKRGNTRGWRGGAPGHEAGEGVQKGLRGLGANGPQAFGHLRVPHHLLRFR